MSEVATIGSMESVTPARLVRLSTSSLLSKSAGSAEGAQRFRRPLSVTPLICAASSLVVVKPRYCRDDRLSMFQEQIFRTRKGVFEQRYINEIDVPVAAVPASG